MLDFKKLLEQGINIEAAKKKVTAFRDTMNEVDLLYKGCLGTYMTKIKLDLGISTYELRVFLMKMIEIPFDESKMTIREKEFAQKIGDIIKEMLPYNKKEDIILN